MSSKKYSTCYFGCENVGILHRFPNPNYDKERFLLWASVLDHKIQKMSMKYIYDNKRLCDLHFETCYRLPNGKLTRNAFPSANLAFHQERNQPLLMDDNILSQAATHHDPVISSSVSALAEINQPLLQSQELIQELLLEARSVLQDVPVDVSTAITIPSTSIDISQSTATYKAYKKTLKKVYNLDHKLKELSQKYKSQSRKIKLAKNLSHSKQFLKLIESFPEPVQVFNKMQCKIKTKPKGRRYTTEEKVFALSIFKQSAKAYNVLKKMFVLPSKRSLQKTLNIIPLEPGINEHVFRHLKEAVKVLPSEKKLCILIFDEIALEAGLFYNKGRIIGFEDFGLKNTCVIADHALVFMLKSIKGKFKQPICYTFCRSSTKKEDLKNLIIELIKKIHTTGLKVVATICDQSQTNVSAIRSLKYDTRCAYLRMEKEYYSNAFEVDTHKIFPLFDTPHLLKGVRNNLLRKDAIFVHNGVQKTAKWEHLKMLFNEDAGEHEIRLVNKLTEAHISEVKIPKMKVKYAVQVFSQRVSSAMRFLACRQILPEECADTADFLLLFDKLFDSFNGYTYSDTPKELTRCLKSSSPHFKFWEEVLPILKSIRYIRRVSVSDGSEKIIYEKVPSISNWGKNIETFIELWKMLRKDFKIFNLLTRNFNQDPLENFFCSIRSNGVRNTNPTCAQFINAYKTLLVNNLSSPHSVNANCEADNNKCLQSLSNLLESHRELDTQRENVNFNIDNLIENLSITSCASLIQHNVIHEESKRYVAGYIIQRCQKSIFKNCSTCKSNLLNDKADPMTYTYSRDYTKKSLIYAKDKFIELTNKIYEIITLCLKDSPQERKLKEKIVHFVNLDVDFNIFTCKTHKLELINGVTNIAINIIVHSWCKTINQLLKGKLVKFDHSDLVKAQARTYYLKRRKIKTD